MRLGRGLGLLVVMMLLVVGPAACTPRALNKAGGPEHGIVLRLATVVGEPGAIPAVDELVRIVAERSRGSLTIDPVYDVGAERPGAEQAVVRGVAHGTWDLGVVGTRVFDTLGVHAFAPLTAPLLIDSYPLETAVVTGDIPVDMLASLRPLGVTGLGVFPGGLSKPIGVERPFVDVGDWRGVTFATFRSEASAHAIATLGARPIDLWGAPLDAAVSAGQIQGFDKSLQVYAKRTMWREAPNVTANVNLWPQTQALVANPTALASLSQEQRTLLTQAVHDVIAASTELANEDQRLVSVLCASGSHFVNASPADLHALRTALQPVFDEMRLDPVSAPFLARIERSKREISAGPPLEIEKGCEPESPAVRPAPTQEPTTRVTPLDGTWVVSYSRQDLIAAHPDPSEITPENIGTFYLVFERGSGWMAPSRSDVGPPTDPGWWYAVDGDTVTIHVDEGAGPATWSYRWSVYEGSLTLKKLGGHEPDCSLSVSKGQCEPTGFVVKPFRRVSG